METGECDRAFFHECLLKAPRGRGPSGAGSVKVSLQWHLIVNTDASKILLDSSSTLPLRKKSLQHIAAVSQDE
ncbi:hypothetical protein NQZ68_030981 [Dissostichus eleginoides]|nr:hypothetical protein NQZ68_030981 [Dissostichus eleginoides]